MVKSIIYVPLGEVHEAVGRVRLPNVLQETWEAGAKLDGDGVGRVIRGSVDRRSDIFRRG